jgi:hypothetical protein
MSNLYCMCECLSCGLQASRVFFDTTISYAEDAMPERNPPREGKFDTCPSCRSIDVDVYSSDGVDILNRIAAVEAAAA